MSRGCELRASRPGLRVAGGGDQTRVQRGVCVRENVSEAARLCLCLQAGSNDDDAAQGLDVALERGAVALRGEVSVNDY